MKPFNIFSYHIPRLIQLMLVLSIMFIWSPDLLAQNLKQPNTDKEKKIPTIRSKGGDGRNVDWVSIKKKFEKEYGSDEENFYFSGDCSQGVKIVSASSTLSSQKSKSYSASNLSDNSPLTAWVEGKSDYGIGEWFKIKSAGVNVIYNGYQSSPANWLKNSRVKKFKVYKNDTPLCFLELTDEMGAQRF